jgi:hypothetical protein
MNKSFSKAILSAIFMTAVVSACGSKYNKLKFKDPNGGKTEIYGNIGGEPVQLSGEYKGDPAVAELSKEATPAFRERVEASVQK